MLGMLSTFGSLVVFAVVYGLGGLLPALAAGIGFLVLLARAATARK